MSINFLYKSLFIVGSLCIITSGILSWIDLSRLNREKNTLMKKLRAETDKASHGISVSYDFNGARRESTKPGYINVIVGKEIAVFKNMLQLQNEKNYPELVKICEHQIKETPEWLTPYLFLGTAYDNLGEKDKAIQMYEYVIENAYGNLEYVDAHSFLGQVYAGKGDFDNTIKEFKSYLKYKPENAIIHNELGIAYDKKGLVDEAIEEYKLALKYKVDFPEAYFYLGISYGRKGMNKEAIQAFENFKKCWKGDKEKIEEVEELLNNLKKN